jgi:hypothetical protein
LLDGKNGKKNIESAKKVKKDEKSASYSAFPMPHPFGASF